MEENNRGPEKNKLSNWPLGSVAYKGQGHWQSLGSAAPSLALNPGLYNLHGISMYV